MRTRTLETLALFSDGEPRTINRPKTAGWLNGRGLIELVGSAGPGRPVYRITSLGKEALVRHHNDKNADNPPPTTTLLT